MSIYSLNTAMPLLVGNDSVFPSLCTIMLIPKVEKPSGQVVVDYSAPLADVVYPLDNLPCRLVPDIKLRSVGGKQNLQEYDRSIEIWNVILSGAYEGIDPKLHVVVVDGMIFELMKSENYGNFINTRLRVRKVEV